MQHHSAPPGEIHHTCLVATGNQAGGAKWSHQRSHLFMAFAHGNLLAVRAHFSLERLAIFSHPALSGSSAAGTFD